MDWCVEFKAGAAKELTKLERGIQKAVMVGLTQLVDELRAHGRPMQADVKKLKGYEPAQYRLRVGDFRVRFLREVRAVMGAQAKKEHEGVLVVLYVRNRKEAYD